MSQTCRISGWIYVALAGVVALWNGSEAFEVSRRSLLVGPAASILVASPAVAAPSGLGARLLQRDPALLKNKLFNVPPSRTPFPGWMQGEWKVQASFAGFVFPSRSISKETLYQDYGIAGFQKCSIATTADVGKELVEYKMRVQNEYDDINSNLQNAIDAYLGYDAVKTVQSNPNNPNRISIDFVDYRTTNAERIELFCNAREYEEYRDDTSRIFVHSEYFRQVTFGTGSTVGVPRQVSTNYANFWTWKEDPDSDNGNQPLPTVLRGNLLTAAYLDPQDPLYFQEPSLPVVIYSHRLTATRI